MKLDKINFSQKKAKDLNFLTRLYQYYAMYILFIPFFGTFFYNFKVQKNKNLDKKKLYIVAPNHTSFFDVFIVNYGVGLPLSYMAKKELFQLDTFLHRYITRNILRLGAFSVNREKVGLSTIKSVKEVFKAKYNLCIFPQGGIRKNRAIENVNEGFVYFAKTNKVDIIPVGISGLEEYNWKIFKKKDVFINIGEPISYELENEEIIKQWCDQVSKLTNYKNLYK